LRAGLADAGFTEGRLGDAADLAPGLLDAARQPLVRAVLLDDGSARALLAALFVYDATVALDAASQALGGDLLSRLVAAGLVVGDGDACTAAFRLTPVAGRLIASDRPHDGSDAVMPPGPTTMELAAALPVDVDGPMADLGTGPGTLALLLARRDGPPVVATDVNPRACALARANAVLNAMPLDVREGSWF
jgi:hypothetical protein